MFAYVRVTPRNDEQLERLHARFPGHPDLPVSTDWSDERNWRWANPAHATFLNLEELRKEAVEAANEPAKQNGFRQYRLNQRVSQQTRWIPMDLWNLPGNIQTVSEADLVGRRCYAGLDLASTTDLAAWALLFPPADPHGPVQVLWRFWTPEDLLPFLDRHLGGRASVWARQGLLTATEGDWIDYSVIHRQIALDARSFRIIQTGYDAREATATAQYMADRLRMKVTPIPQGYALSGALKDMMRLIKAGRWQHGGHPVARWNADSAEIRSRTDDEAIKLVKPDRDRGGARVDGISAGANAIAVWHELGSATQAPAASQAAGAEDHDFFRPTGRLTI